MYSYSEDLECTAIVRILSEALKGLYVKGFEPLVLLLDDGRMFLPNRDVRQLFKQTQYKIKDSYIVISCNVHPWMGGPMWPSVYCPERLGLRELWL